MAKDEFGTNKSNTFNKEDDMYVETLVIRGKAVNVFLSNSGQCYWFQYVDDKGELQSMTCGTFCYNYKEEIEDYFKPEEDKQWESIKLLQRYFRDLVKENEQMDENIRSLAKKVRKLTKKVNSKKEYGRKTLQIGQTITYLCNDKTSKTGSGVIMDVKYKDGYVMVSEDYNPDWKLVYVGHILTVQDCIYNDNLYEDYLRRLDNDE